MTTISTQTLLWTMGMVRARRSAALALFLLFFTSTVQADDFSWPMLASNPQRTSWTATEVRGNLSVEWYRPIEPYIPYKIQPIAANSKIYVSTARGLYAISALTGNLDWVYPTELPLGHSPTIASVNGTSVAYVGGYDHKIHAINAITGVSLAGYSPYEAEAGFETNPLVIQDQYTNNQPIVFAGNRDGNFYALDAMTGALRWKFSTEDAASNIAKGPILFSAAYKNGVIFFAANNAYAYAITTNGVQVWRSGKFGGQGFHSFWPVIYTHPATNKDYVVFTGGENYRHSEFQLQTSENPLGETSLLFNASTDPGVVPSGNTIDYPANNGAVPGDWAQGTVTMDAHRITNYLEKYPYRHFVFVLDSTTGKEFTFDSDNDGKPEYAPFVWSEITSAGSKYPPIVNGMDRVYYQATAYYSGGWVSRGGPVGWKFGTNILSRVDTGNGPQAQNGHASDEPMAYSSGGRLIYWALCCDREAGAYDVTMPLGQSNRDWYYYGYSLGNLAPNYRMMYNDGDSTLYNNNDGWQVYSGKNLSKNGVYSNHSSTQSPPIPYQGKVYLLKGNALIALSPTGANPSTPLPLASTVPIQRSFTLPSKTTLTQRLETEIQKIITAGHLRPGYYPASFYDIYGVGSYTDEREFGEIFDYFSNPSDTVVTLLQALPLLSPTAQSQVKTYVQNNYGPGTAYDFTKIVHIGWGAGAQREVFDTPPEETDPNNDVALGRPYRPPLNPSTRPICGGDPNGGYGCGYWFYFSPYNFYAAWKYAQVFGSAQTIFQSMKDKIEAFPGTADLRYQNFIDKPYLINAYIAGYKGYLELQKLAYPSNSPDATVQNWYNQAVGLRTSTFSKDTPYWKKYWWGNTNYNRTLSVARNFMFLTPESADYLRQNILAQAKQAFDEYSYVAPYWFVSNFDSTYGEGTFQHLYDSPSLFQAKAYILKDSYNELAKWLDVPAFPRGDLFYIQNLVAALSAASPTSGADLTLSKTHVGNFAQGQTAATYSIIVSNVGNTITSGTVTVTDSLPSGLTATAISGSGWNCMLSTLNCSRSDTLAAGANFPAIVLTVNIASNALSNVTNIAVVNGGADSDPGNNTAYDPTNITGVGGGTPDLQLSVSHTGNFIQGQSGANYTLNVSNVGTGASSGTVTVTDTLPSGLTPTSLGGSGWNCSVGTLSCSRTDSLAASASYPNISLTVNVSTDAASSLTNTATVNGGADNSPANNSATDPTTIVASTTGPLTISNVTSLSQIGKYLKFEIAFDIAGTVAKNLQLPYDPAPPNGIDLSYDGHKGISVDAEFTPDNWQTVYRQPAFFYRYYQDGGVKPSWDGHSHEWYYPTGRVGWKVRFSPNQVGTWQYRINAVDASGSATSGAYSFTVNSSLKKGFVRVGKRDARYFEFEDGTPFLSPALEVPFGSLLIDPVNSNQSRLTDQQRDHINLNRDWVSQLYGSAWPQWLGGRNLYDGYLPRPALVPFHDSVRNRDMLTMYIKYPEDWFDACQWEGWHSAEAVKTNTTYKLTIKYWGYDIAGPRVAGTNQFGLTGKITPGTANNCYEPGTGIVVTNYGGNTSDWGTIEGTWYSGSDNFLPKVSLGLENVTQGKAFVLSISLKEVLGNGQYGPEILHESSMEYELNFPDLGLYAMDKYVDLAEAHDIYLKLVMMEKNDLIYTKLNDDGTFVKDQDNLNGFYGLGRGMNKTRWLQRAWWRYAQARWGYSTNIHSWELTNEGDPFLTKHWEMTDEFGKFMHCRAFGVNLGTGDSQPCTLEHPNHHMVTTSFWQSFPGYDPLTGNGFWGNPKYPNVDYADGHAYIATSPAPDADKILMERDAAYYHLWHSKEWGGWKFKFPIMRGEAGMVPYNGSTDDWAGLGLQRDTEGIWYHNFVWSSLDSGALYENYWHTVHVYDAGVYDHRPTALSWNNFMAGIPLNNGSYQDLEAMVSNANLRVVGQKDMTNGNAHLWIQNKNHTWKNVVDGVSITPVSGTIQLGGFASNQNYTVEWWDTYKTTGQVMSTQTVASASDGTLAVSVMSLTTDVGLKIIGSSSLPPGTIPKAPQNLRIN